MSSSRQTPEPAPSGQKASRKWNWSPLASLEKYFVGFTVRSYPWTYRFCFSWLADVDCVMPLLSQTDLGMVKCAKARNAKCFKKGLHTRSRREAMERKAFQIITPTASSSLCLDLAVCGKAAPHRTYSHLKDDIPRSCFTLTRVLVVPCSLYYSWITDLATSFRSCCALRFSCFPSDS